MSIVPPAYYAQLAAERGQVLSQGKSLLGEEGVAAMAAAAAAAGSNGSSDNGTSAAADVEEPAAVGVSPEFDVRVNVRLGGSMYYV